MGYAYSIHITIDAKQKLSEKNLENLMESIDIKVGQVAIMEDVNSWNIKQTAEKVKTN